MSAQTSRASPTSRLTAKRPPSNSGQTFSTTMPRRSAGSSGETDSVTFIGSHPCKESDRERSEHVAQPEAGPSADARSDQLLAGEGVAKARASWGKAQPGVGPDVRSDRWDRPGAGEAGDQHRSDGDDGIAPQDAGEGAHVPAPGATRAERKVGAGCEKLRVGATGSERVPGDVELDAAVLER